MSERTLVRVVDDDAAMRDALVFLLESEGWKVAAYETAEQFLTRDAYSVAGCLVLDVRMPGMGGLRLQKVLRERGVSIPIIFLTGHGDIDMAVAAMKEGAVEFLQKPLDNERFLKAVASSVALSRRGVADIPLGGFEARKLWLTLTEREQDIMRRIAAGSLNKDIAARLGISVRTVEAHRASARKKLGFGSAAELNRLLFLVDGGG